MLKWDVLRCLKGQRSDPNRSEEPARELSDQRAKLRGTPQGAHRKEPKMRVVN